MALLRLTVGLTLLTACAATSPAGLDARVRNLAKQEESLRASVVELEERQRSLHHEIAIAQQRAEQARCEAKRDELAATTANLSAQYSMAYANHQACKADAAKGGGLAAALGCGAAAFLTGGWALALCGGALATGYIASESCSEAPPLPPPEQVQREALAQLGLQSPPRCDRSPRTLTSPYGSTAPSARPGITGVMEASPTAIELIGTGRGAATSSPPTSAQPAAAPAPAPTAAPPQPTVDPAVEAARRRRETERARAAKAARDQAAAEDRARVRAAQIEAEWAREKALRKSRRRTKTR